MSNDKPVNQFVDSIRDLPAIQKVILVLVVLAGFYLIGYFLLQGAGEQAVEEETPTTITQPLVQPSEHATAPPVEYLDGNLSNNNIPTVDGKQLPEVSKDNKLSVSESRKALKVAEQGAVEFSTWGQKETLEARKKRIDKFFDKNSKTKSLSIDSSDSIESDYNAEQKTPKYAYYSEIVSSAIAGGDKNRFRISIGMKVRFAEVSKETGKLDSAVREQYPIYTVDLKKQGNEWKILELVNDGE